MQKRQERGCKKERGEYRQVSPWQITRRGEIDVERQGQSEAVCRFSTHPPLLLDKAMATPPIHVDTNLLFPPGPSTCIKVQSFVERRLIILPSDSISLAALLFVPPPPFSPSRFITRPRRLSTRSTRRIQPEVFQPKLNLAQFPKLRLRLRLMLLELV